MNERSGVIEQPTTPATGQQTYTVTAGTFVRVNGISVALVEDTAVLATPEQWKLMRGEIGTSSER